MNRHSWFPAPIVLILLLASTLPSTAVAAGREQTAPEKRIDIPALFWATFAELLKAFGDASDGLTSPSQPPLPGSQKPAVDGDLGPGMDPWG
jgi:hypothetical protein